MINEKAFMLGTQKSKIRELFEFGKELEKTKGKAAVFDFTIGNPSTPCPENVTKTAVKLLSGDPVKVHSYTVAQGDEKAREAISAAIFKKYGAKMPANLIYMTCGASAALAIILKAIVSSPRDRILTFAPFFPEYSVFTENAGAKLKIVKANEADFSINFSDLKNKLTKNVQAVIINSPNNPSGTVYDEKTIKKLSAVLKEKEKEFGHVIYLISDEPYREILFDGASCPYVPNYYDDTVVCYSFSKSLSLPGERIGYLAVSEKAQDSRKLFNAIAGAGRMLGYVCAPSLFQKVIEECVYEISDISDYKDNRDVLISELNGYGFSVKNPKGAFYIFMKSPAKTATEFSDKAKEYGILVVPSDSFGIKGYVRIATCVSKDTVIRSLPKFKELARFYNL